MNLFPQSPTFLISKIRTTQYSHMPSLLVSFYHLRANQKNLLKPLIQSDSRDLSKPPHQVHLGPLTPSIPLHTLALTLLEANSTPPPPTQAATVSILSLTHPPPSTTPPSLSNLHHTLPKNPIIGDISELQSTTNSFSPAAPSPPSPPSNAHSLTRTWKKGGLLESIEKGGKLAKL